MKKLWFGIVAFLVGELVAIAHKDKQFKKTLQNKQWLDRRKYIFESLFNFNKELVQKAPAQVESMKAWAVEEYDTITSKVSELEAKANEWSQEKIKPHLAELQERFAEFKAKSKELSEDMNLEEKIDMIKAKLDAIHKKMSA